MKRRDYFDGYRAEKPHPMMASTGSEGRCDICGRRETRDHEPPYERVVPQFEELPDPGPPYVPPLPYTGPTRVLIEL